MWSENARKEVSRNTVGVCVEPICIELMVCVCVGVGGGADLNDQPAKVDGARKPDKSRNKRLNLSRS